MNFLDIVVVGRGNFAIYVNFVPKISDLTDRHVIIVNQWTVRMFIIKTTTCELKKNRTTFYVTKNNNIETIRYLPIGSLSGECRSFRGSPTGSEVFARTHTPDFF